MMHINSDYESVLTFLPFSMKVINNSVSLYQIKREILLIKQWHKIQIHPNKVKAHKDKLLPWNKLSFLEKLNIIYDEKAKHLITSETMKYVPFPFSLQSPYVVNREMVMRDYIISLNVAFHSFTFYTVTHF